MARAWVPKNGGGDSRLGAPNRGGDVIERSGNVFAGVLLFLDSSSLCVC